MQATDDVHLGAPIVERLLATSDDLLVAHDVSLGITQIRTKRTKAASIDTHIGRIQMRVDVVVPNIAIDLLSLPIGQFANLVQRDFRVVEENPFVETQTTSLLDLIANDSQAIFDLKTVHNGDFWESIDLSELSKPRVEGPCPENHDADYGVELKKCQLHPIQRPLRNYRVLVNQQGSNPQQC